jgi:hypothetical protein
MAEKKGVMHRLSSQYHKMVHGDEYYVRKEVMKAFNPLLGWVGDGLMVRRRPHPLDNLLALSQLRKPIITSKILLD